MTVFKKWILTSFILIVGILLFLNSSFFISNQTWKYRDGFHIGDWLDFNSNVMHIEGRSIIKNGQKVGRIKFCFGKMLILKDVKSYELGYYINK